MFLSFHAYIKLPHNRTKIPLKANQGGKKVTFKRRQQHKFNTLFVSKPPAAALCRYTIVSPHTIHFVLTCAFGPKCFSSFVPDSELTPLFSWNGSMIMTQQTISETENALLLMGDSPYELLPDSNNHSCNSCQCCFWFVFLSELIEKLFSFFTSWRWHWVFL